MVAERYFGWIILGWLLTWAAEGLSMFQRLLGTVALSGGQWPVALGGDPYACGHRHGHSVAPAKQSRFTCPKCPMTPKRLLRSFPRVWSSAGWFRLGSSAGALRRLLLSSFSALSLPTGH